MGFYPGKFPVVVDMAGGMKLAGTLVTADAAELNLVDGVSAPAADGLGLLRVARATYDFAEHGGAIGAISLGVTLLFLVVFLAIVAWIFKTGYRIKA